MNVNRVAAQLEAMNERHDRMERALIAGLEHFSPQYDEESQAFAKKVVEILKERKEKPKAGFVPPLTGEA